jgi:hypothetical protein
MEQYYSWFVFIHLIGLVLFAISHGASAFIAFRIRQERDPRVIGSLLATSQRATQTMYLGLLLLALGGIAAATSTGLWSQPWVIASVVVLLIVIVTMYAVASPYYIQLRRRVGDGLATGTETSPVVSATELETLLDTRRPDILVAVGTIGLVVLVWLMVLKPG